MKSSDSFVHSVMTALPRRESLLERIGRLCLRFILSPLWLWTCFAFLVAIFRQPIITLLWSITESPTINFLIIVGSIAASVFILTRQMLKDFFLLNR